MSEFIHINKFKPVTRLLVKLSLLSLVFSGLTLCNSDNHQPGTQSISRDLDKIRERGKLVAITDFNSINYFIYRGQPLGYQYELLQNFSDYLGLKLEILVNSDIDETFESLNTGESDLIAMNLAVTKERKERIAFTLPHSHTRQVLVQRKPVNWQQLSSKAFESTLIRNQLDLAGENVVIYVQKNSAHVQRLQNLSGEIGDSIRYIEVPEESEELIALVAKGEIDYTVCDENVAMVNSTYYPGIDIRTPVSFPQNLAWGVRKDSEELLEVLNNWLDNFKKTSRYTIIYNKYFKNQKFNDINNEYFSLTSGKVSPFDDAIKKYAAEIDWDWKLLASLIYQESRFNPSARSWAGAFGLMQLMPATAGRFGVTETSPPEMQIRAGVQFIQWLDNQLVDEVKDKNERLKFILASYNMGLGHVLDARRLARKNGKDPNIWENNVDFFIKNKSNPNFYRDPVVKYGFAMGDQAYNYVYEILGRYDHYKNIITSR
ncbi:MAG: transporter substrate-binding domain-containing protein [Bacteroidales bacterium]